MPALGLEPTVVKRKKGQNEYLIWSAKAGAALTLYEKSHVLYLLRQEFSPHVTALSGEAFQLKTPYGTAVMPISASLGDQLKLAIFDSPQLVVQQVAALCEQRGWILDVITTSQHTDSSHEFWNLLEMQQWLLRWGGGVREKDIQIFARSMRSGHSFALQQQLSSEDAVNQLTMIYELVRRGRLVPQDICTRRICQDSIFLVRGD
ncbi:MULTISPECIES: hypothetical protein [Pseudomonas]|uniref:Uncharacterized protein n=1 Tax=Aquipseudomonas alcaligenes TaxID=43263 RepID=A0ABR7S1J3_AQUAC|nr:MULTISPECIES: hypothetical protein [Pseudomonas]MBC9250665.1 hypothetical protein [Pseudomonas alcaligenes]MDG9925691.1 hypothetical protein [Pseudomonas sp. GD04045]MDH0037192.1 hypothetical protein [Pseudomonas sp. GD04019]